MMKIKSQKKNLEKEIQIEELHIFQQSKIKKMEKWNYRKHIKKE